MSELSKDCRTLLAALAGVYPENVWHWETESDGRTMTLTVRYGEGKEAKYQVTRLPS